MILTTCYLQLATHPTSTMSKYSITSKTETVNKPDTEVYGFLTDFHNFHDLWPADKIANWECTENSCSFSVIGIISVQLHIENKIPCSLVSYKSSPGSKYPFNFTIEIIRIDENSCNCRITMDYEMNVVLNGMAEKSLVSLVNKMGEKLKEIFQ